LIENINENNPLEIVRSGSLGISSDINILNIDS
jgi:hypothetical protein